MAPPRLDHLTITITGTNDAPVAVADTNAATRWSSPGSTRATRRSRAMLGDRQRADQRHRRRHRRDQTVAEVNGSAANVGVAVAGTYGSVTINADGSYSYTLDNADRRHNAWPRASVGDRRVQLHGDRRAWRDLDSTTLTITITGTNDAPVAVADTNAATRWSSPGSTRATRRSRAMLGDRQRADQRHRRRHRRDQGRGRRSTARRRTSAWRWPAPTAR